MERVAGAMLVGFGMLMLLGAVLVCIGYGMSGSDDLRRLLIVLVPMSLLGGTFILLGWLVVQDDPEQESS